MKKRILSLLLALTMLVSMLPVQALAEDVPEAPAVPETTAATEAPTVPETTAATEAPTIPETTAETEAPTVPETTAETEVPVESTVEATESAMTVMSDEANTCGENLAWKVEDGTLTIYATAEEFGEIEDYAKGDAPWYSQRDSITTVDMQAGYWFGSGAFYGLSKVTLVKLPKCLVSFEDAFEGCTSLTSFCFPQGNEAGFAVDFYLTGDDGVNYGSEIVDESASDGSRRLCALAPAAEPYSDYTSWFRYISTGALRGCQVTDLAFKMDVTVDYNAFINCDSLKTVTVYKSATFADSVFAGCSKLESITFVADAPRLSANAFNGLDDVTIHYYSDANGWESVAGLDYGGSNITWDAVEPATEGTCGDNLSWSFDADTGVLSIDAVDPEQSCGGITAYNYGDAPWYRYRDQITSIDMNAGLSIGGSTIFADLANVTHINLPKDLEELSSNDFSPLYNLTSIAFPEGNANGFSVVDETSVIKTEGDKVTLITTAKGAACTIPDSVTTIGSNALSWRYIGDTLVIPATVTELEDYALYQCTVTTIRFTGNAPIIGDNAFGDVSANVIYPAENGTWTDDVIANMYGGTLVWVKEGETPTSGVCGFNLLWDFDAETNTLTISANNPDEVAYMDSYAEGNAPWDVHRENITEVDLNSCRNIGENAFYGLSELTTFRLSGDLEEIGAGAFAGCTQLTSFWGESTVYYGAGATILQKTASFGPLVVVVSPGAGETLYLPGQTSAILPGALTGCDSIQTIIFPDTFRHLQEGALDGCNSDLTLTFRGIEPPYIEKLAFAGFNITVDCLIDGGWQDVALAGNYGANSITWPEELFFTIGEDHNYCGQDLAWKIEDGTLIIYAPIGPDGGPMTDYEPASAPWYDQRDSITTIDMQAGITIGAHAFDGLSNVTTVNLPQSLMYFTGSFGECTSLETFAFPNDNDYGYSVVDGGKAIVREDLDGTINLYAVVPTVSGEYTVPGDVQAIHYGAFAGCTGIDKVTFPEGLVLVCGDALTGCGDGTEFVFTGDAPDLQEDAFLGLSDITVSYPVQYPVWGDLQQEEYFGATGITWNGVYPSVESGVCGQFNALMWKVEGGVLTIYEPNGGEGSMMLSYTAENPAPWASQASSITTIDMQAGITIGAHAFDGLSNVTTVNLPQSLMYFTGSFGECTSLETFAFPNDNDYGYSVVDGGKAIVREDLDGTINLYAVVPTVSGEYTVPGDVQAIHYGAFAGCTGIDEVTFPAGLVLVCGDALTGCGDGTEFVFTGDAPEMEDNAFDGLTDVTVTYPGDADGWEEIVDNFGEDIIFENTYAVVLDESNPTTLLAGKSATLKASLSPSNLTKTSIVWSLKNGDDSEFATISASGRLTAKTAITEKHAIVVVAASKDGKATPAEYTVTLIPKASSVSVFVNGEDATNGEYFIDLNDDSRPESYTFRADIAPDDAGQAVTWKVSDTKGTYVTYEEVNEDGTTELMVTPAETGKTGTVTVTATAADGSNKSAKVTLRIAKLAQAVHILKENVPGYDEQTDTIHVCGGGKIVLTTDVAANKELTDRTILWSLSDDSIPYAAISTNGTLTTYPVSVSTTITVKATVKANPEVSDEVQITLHPAVDAVTIKPIGAQMEALDDWDITNGTIDFDAVCFPEGAMTEGEWSVSSTKLATIDKETGVLTPLNAGKVKVTFKTTDGSRKQATVQVTIVKPVRAVTVEAVNLPESGILYSGQTLSLKATTWSDEDCTIPATNQKVYWNVVERYTENGSTWEWLSSAATISSSGKLTVKAVANNVQVYAVAASEENWVLGEIPLTIQPKQENTLAITIGGSTLDENGEVISTWFRPMENQEWMQPGESYEIGGAWFNRTSEEYTSILEGCTITSSNAKVASIDNGVLSIVAPGTTTLTAKCLGEDGKTQTATAVLTVRYYVDHVTIAEPTTRDLRSGQSLSLKASVWADEDETIKATNQKVWWEVYEVVTDPDTGKEELIYGSDAATISSSGKLTAKNVTENVKVRVFASSQDDYWLDDYVDITIRPKQPYQTSIYQSGMKCSGTVNIPVNLLGDGVLPASELSVQTYVSVPGSEYDGTYVSGEEYNAQWSSSNTKVADFDANDNLVFTGTLGSTTITVTGTIDELAVSAKVTLKAVKAVTSVDVQQKVAGQKLYSGKSINLTATVDSDATNKKVTWVSSDPSIATVSTSGQVKAGKVYEQKQVTIYAEAQDGFGTVGEITLTVYPMATTVSIMSGGRVMNNRVETISVGETVELTAVVYPIGEASSDVKWTPASNAVVDVTVGEDGVVTITAKKKGTVTIKAAAQDGSGKSASFKLTVNP
ncbi:MAG: leucine-rich repeat protein [Faecousia sp.]